MAQFVDAIAAALTACNAAAWAAAFPDTDCPAGASALDGLTVSVVRPSMLAEQIEADVAKLGGRLLLVDWVDADFEDPHGFKVTQRAMVQIWSAPLLLPTDAAAAHDVAETAWQWMHGNNVGRSEDLPDQFKNVTCGKLAKLEVTSLETNSLYIVYSFEVTGTKTLARSRES